ncbi:hypothetical protein FEK35_27345 [Nocardia cyriacigeorgica]|uniref:Uncharacterized protein n=1 Tax=Nocardia cyriacigeorgica TaxID=135487 RepID=A0A5R8P676_9NOCA|nr:hypothetical protein [Nocardia cyriacigeorgica]TLF96810.1 hypothetical protein FEK35_27345 [Nocardia cyriacigeorgica]
MVSCCSSSVAGSGNVPGGLRVNVVCGDPVNLSFHSCGGWPADLTATLELSHPWGWSLSVLGKTTGEWLNFLIPAAQAKIPRDSHARIRFSIPGLEPYTWKSGRVYHRGSC